MRPCKIFVKIPHIKRRFEIAQKQYCVIYTKNKGKTKKIYRKLQLKTDIIKKEKKNGQVDKMSKQEHNGMNPRKVYDRKDEDYVSEN